MGRDKPGKPRKPRKDSPVEFVKPEPRKIEGLTISSDVDPISGAYICTINAGNDLAFVLGPDRVMRYVSQVLAVANQADHDCAVMRQLHQKLGMPVEDAAEVVLGSLRPDRPPTDHEATFPLEFHAGVGMKGVELHGYVAVARADRGKPEELGRWPVRTLVEHAMTVIAVVHSNELDFGYFKALRSLIGVEEDRARNVVMDLSNYRDGFTWFGDE